MPSPTKWVVHSKNSNSRQGSNAFSSLGTDSSSSTWWVGEGVRGGVGIKFGEYGGSEMMRYDNLESERVRGPFRWASISSKKTQTMSYVKTPEKCGSVPSCDCVRYSS